MPLESPPPGIRERQVRRDLTLALLALVSVAIGVHDYTTPRAAPGLNWIDYVDLAIVAYFIGDFAWHARKSGSVGGYVRKYWWELPSLVPVTGGLVAGYEGVQLLRGVRLVRLFRVARLLRVAGSAARLRRLRRYVARIAGRARLAALLAVGFGLVIVAAVMVFLAESRENSRLASMTQALWWGLSSVTRGGFVDATVVTAAGRLVAGSVAVLSALYFGVVTASLASAILREPGPDDEEVGEEAEVVLD